MHTEFYDQLFLVPFLLFLFLKRFSFHCAPLLLSFRKLFHEPLPEHNFASLIIELSNLQILMLRFLSLAYFIVVVTAIVLLSWAFLHPLNLRPSFASNRLPLICWLFLLSLPLIVNHHARNREPSSRSTLSSKMTVTIIAKPIVWHGIPNASLLHWRTISNHLWNLRFLKQHLLTNFIIMRSC